jgi:hypothetical protein
LATAYRMVEARTVPSARFGAGSAIRVPLEAVEAHERKHLGRVPAALAADDVE